MQIVKDLQTIGKILYIQISIYIAIHRYLDINIDIDIDIDIDIAIYIFKRGMKQAHFNIEKITWKPKSWQLI